VVAKADVLPLEQTAPGTLHYRTRLQAHFLVVDPEIVPIDDEDTKRLTLDSIAEQRRHTDSPKRNALLGSFDHYSSTSTSTVARTVARPPALPCDASNEKLELACEATTIPSIVYSKAR